MGTLRLLLAISVILFHVNANGFQLVGGGIAVEAFFIISGFYMSLVLDTKYTGRNRGYGLFITNRLLKLYPAYWTVLLLALLMQLVCWLTTGYPILVLYHIVHFNMNWPGIVLLGFSNIAIIGQDMLSFLGFHRLRGDLFFTADFMKTYPYLFNFIFIPQGWTLGIELGFYLLAPLLLKRKWYVIVLCMLLSFSLRQYLLYGLDLHYDPWVFRFLPSQLLLFLAGNIVYRLYAWREVWFSGKPAVSLSVLAILVVITCLYSQLPVIPEKRTAYLLVVMASLPFLLNTNRLLRPDNYFGELSYPVYLCHMLVLQTISMVNSQTGWFSKVSTSLLTLVLSLLLAALINKWVARPVNQFRQRRVSKEKLRQTV